MLILPHCGLLATFKVFARAMSSSRVVLSRMVFMLLIGIKQTYNMLWNKGATGLDNLEGQMRQFVNDINDTRHNARGVASPIL